MSILARIQELEGNGQLIPYKPTVARPVHPQGGRKLWLTPDTFKWCFPEEQHPDARITDKSLAHLGDQFNAFVAGEWIDYQGGDMRRLCPDTNDIWEIKSHLHKPQLRVFGWFVLPKYFVGTNCAVRDDLERKKGPKWDAAIEESIAIRSELIGHVSFWHIDSGEYVRNPK